MNKQSVTHRKISVLFLCTGNSCRSQMAEGWARKLHPETINPCSAGVEAHGLNSLAVRVMAEVGVDISSQKSKLFDEIKNCHFDAVVTVCSKARESCPVFPGKARVIHKSFDDPPRLVGEAMIDDEEEALPIYRRVRDEIRGFIERLPTLLKK